MIDHRIFWTLYAIYVVLWFSILPMITFGMGPGKPDHELWKHRSNLAMLVVGTLVLATVFVHFLTTLWA